MRPKNYRDSVQYQRFMARQYTDFAVTALTAVRAVVQGTLDGVATDDQADQVGYICSACATPYICLFIIITV
jgi:hypothetical protein